MNETRKLRKPDHMTGEEKSSLYKTLNECTALLNEDVSTGICAVYATMDRHRYNELLKAIAEAKRILVRANSKEFGDG